MSELILRARTEVWMAFELPRGRMLDEPYEARVALARLRARSGAVISDVISRLLRFDTELVGAHPTPERLKVLQQLVEESLLPRAVVSPVLEAQSVSDAVWETIQPLKALLAPLEKLMLRWVITLEGDAAASVKLPKGVLGFAGEVFWDDPLPAERLLKAILHLRSFGWYLRHGWMSRCSKKGIYRETGTEFPPPIAAEFRFARHSQPG